LEWFLWHKEPFGWFYFNLFVKIKKLWDCLEKSYEPFEWFFSLVFEVRYSYYYDDNLINLRCFWTKLKKQKFIGGDGSNVVGHKEKFSISLNSVQSKAHKVHIQTWNTNPYAFKGQCRKNLLYMFDNVLFFMVILSSSK
jgi:hypothetical protein